MKITKILELTSGKTHIVISRGIAHRKEDQSYYRLKQINQLGHTIKSIIYTYHYFDGHYIIQRKGFCYAEDGRFVSYFNKDNILVVDGSPELIAIINADDEFSELKAKDKCLKLIMEEAKNPSRIKN